MSILFPCSSSPARMKTVSASPRRYIEPTGTTLPETKGPVGLLLPENPCPGSQGDLRPEEILVRLRLSLGEGVPTPRRPLLPPCRPRLVCGPTAREGTGNKKEQSGEGDRNGETPPPPLR